MYATQILRVCPRCMAAIESREGRQLVTTVYLDWCDEVIEDGYCYEW